MEEARDPLLFMGRPFFRSSVATQRVLQRRLAQPAGSLAWRSLRDLQGTGQRLRRGFTFGCRFDTPSVGTELGDRPDDRLASALTQ